MRFGQRRRLARIGWKDLLRDPTDPGRTSLSVALGALVGSTPVLGVHTWASVGLATLCRLPPMASLLGSNLSNPITFVPITLLEVRVGSWILGRDPTLIPRHLDAGELGLYAAAAWVGCIPVGLAMGLVTYGITRVLLERRRLASPPAADHE
jgi:uncharacterized protein (DUF2062 family)